MAVAFVQRLAYNRIMVREYIFNGKCDNGHRQVVIRRATNEPGFLVRSGDFMHGIWHHSRHGYYDTTSKVKAMVQFLLPSANIESSRLERFLA